ncbi:MAG: hypothetical protein IPH04_01135 [Saprospirales bacterium]|nr:hypothetical protein [Saprospirales bacterium]
MKDKDRFSFKDQILRFLLESENKSNSISLISVGLKSDFHIIYTLSMDLIAEGFVESRGEISANKMEWRGDHILLLSPKGHFFLQEEGGFKRRLIRKKQDFFWKITRTAAAVANALAIIGISIWAISIADKSNNLEKILLIKKIINALNLELQTLESRWC